MFKTVSSGRSSLYYVVCSIVSFFFVGYIAVGKKVENVGLLFQLNLTGSRSERQIQRTALVFYHSLDDVKIKSLG